MEFPLYLGIGPLKIHPHILFESLAYVLGFAAYRHLRQRHGDSVSDHNRWSVIVAAAVGAAVGAKLLYWLEDPWLTLEQWRNPLYLIGGKTIVGGLVGGLIGVEITKRWIGVTTRTGDLFAIPLALGIAIGRVGCFLTGLADGTYGNPTSLWMGIDFGDGIPRHPTQLYEILFLVLLAATLTRIARHPPHTGDVFRLFMVGYLGFRLVVESIKPTPTLGLGLSTIQWACVAALVYYLPDVRRWVRERRAVAPMSADAQV